MSRLSIPLSTRLGTRQSTSSRRVLWLILFWLFVVIFSFGLSKLWFTRDTLTKYAPNDTVVTIHLTPSRLAWTKINEDFGQTPLITGRPLTTKDLSTFKTKELAIFISENNESSIAIRANDKDLPRDLLNSYGITLQKLKNDQWLLSSKLLPFSTENKNVWNFSSIWPKNLGFIVLNNFIGQIKLSSNGYEIKVPKIKSPTNYLPALPENTVAAVSLQKNQQLDLSGLFGEIGSLLDPLELVDSNDFNQKIEENGGLVLLASSNQEDNKTEFLIESEIDSLVLSQTLQTIAAFQNPKLTLMDMPDNSIVQEITVSPQEVEFQSQWINGLEAKVVETPTGNILALESENKNIITSNQDLLENFLNKKFEKNNPTCGSKKNLVFLKPEEIKNLLFEENFSFSKPNLLETALNFNEIAINNGKLFLCF